MLAISAGATASAIGQTPQDDERQAVRVELERLRGEFDRLRQQYDERLNLLEARLSVLDSSQSQSPAVPPQVPSAPVPGGASGAGGPTGTLPVYGNAASLSKIFNPDIALIGNVVGAAGANGRDDIPPIELREVEATFQAIIDPYARADFFFGFDADGAGIEEGYVTFPALPGGLLAKVGKFRSAIGRVNALHAHNLPWADRPLVTENLLGGDEGIAPSGLSASRLISNPWVFLEMTGELSAVGDDLGYVARARGYQDFSESSNVDLGLSFATGGASFDAAEGESANVRIIGVDGTFRYRPLRRAIYRRLLARTELVWRREAVVGEAAFGAYLAGEYQFARRWFAGGRWDYSERALDPRASDDGTSGILTFWPSEFSQIRGQFRRTHYEEGHTANEMLFQMVFSIGAHGAHGF